MGYQIRHRRSPRDVNHHAKPWWQENRFIVTTIATSFWLLAITAALLNANSQLVIGFYGVAILFGAYGPTRAGLMALRNRMPLDMNVLMIIAVVGAVYLGEYSEAATVAVLFSVGKMLEVYSMDKTRQSIRSLMDLTPTAALVKRNGEEISIAIEEVLVGDIMIIKPGTKIAVDGKVVNGISAVNQAPITGESLPVTKEAGAQVYAGTINEEGYLEIEVTNRIGDTTLDRIIELVEEAQAQKAPSQRFVDVFARYYTPIVILLALGIAFIPPLLLGQAFHDWFYRGISLLVVSCPCALVISTPVSIVSAIGNAARHGILIKGGAYLEMAGGLKAIAFDKTGTLTAGTPEVVAIESFGTLTQQALLRLAASVEVASEHPLAQAIVNKAQLEKVDLGLQTDFVSVTGQGVQASVDGKIVYVGKPKYILEQLGIPGGELQSRINHFEKQGQTTVLIAGTDRVQGLIAIADTVRKESRNVISHLKEIGMQDVIMLTGDNKQTAAHIAADLQIAEFHADLLPEDKVNAVKKLLQKYGQVAMVGDGINDAPALATATVGIAMGGAGTDTALETADIVLMADDLQMLPYSMSLSRKTLTIIKQNIWFSLIVKLIAIALVFPGWLTLWIAVMADTGAALVVIFNGMRLLGVKPKKQYLYKQQNFAKAPANSDDD